MGLILLGLWGMLALLLGASVGKETRYRADLKADLQPGFGETRATPHPLKDGAEGSADRDLPPYCVAADCFGTEEVVATAYLDRPLDDGLDDDATSAIGKPRGPQGSPNAPPLNIAQGGTPNPLPNGLFIPGGGGNPNPGGGGNPNGGNPNGGDPNAPGNPDVPQKPGDTPPPDFTQPPFSNPPGLDGPGPDGPGPNGPGPNGPGPDGPGPGEPGPGGPPNDGPDKPLQIPEPFTLSLFAAGLAGSVLLRRRKARSSK